VVVLLVLVLVLVLVLAAEVLFSPRTRKSYVREFVETEKASLLVVDEEFETELVRSVVVVAVVDVRPLPKELSRVYVVTEKLDGSDLPALSE
jgi:hypothetical protein